MLQEREWDKATVSSSWQFEQKPQQFLATSAPVTDNKSVSSFAYGSPEVLSFTT